MARLCLGTFLVITEPAPVYDPSDRVIGATIEVLDPTKTPSSILVLFLFFAKYHLTLYVLGAF